MLCIKCHNAFHRKYKFEALEKPELLVDWLGNKNKNIIKEYIKNEIK